MRLSTLLAKLAERIGHVHRIERGLAVAVMESHLTAARDANNANDGAGFKEYMLSIMTIAGRQVVTDDGGEALPLAEGETIHLRIGGSVVEVAAIRQKGADELALSLGGVDCNLSGEEPGLYYLTPR